MDKKYFKTLDGLKGIAIISVMLTHMPLFIFYTFFPKFFHPVLNMIFGGGGIGVSIFFIITGFLMGFRYRQIPSPLEFISRRYRRLFPAFLVMATCFAVVSYFGDFSPFLKTATFLLCALIMYSVILLSEKLIKKRISVTKIFTSFLIFQFTVAVFYSQFLLRVPSAVYYEKWPKLIQTIIAYLVNVTLTLPFGNYIGQLDGIYWALCLEVMFYILYPVLILPLYNQSGKVNIRIRIIIFLLLIPFFFGLSLIGLRVLGFEIFKLHYFIYFIAGIIVSRNIGVVTDKSMSFVKSLSNPLWIIFWILLLYGSVPLNHFIPKIYSPLFMIIMVFPAMILLIIAVIISGKFKNLLENRYLIFFGKYSYVLFLTHSFAIGIAGSLFPADDVFGVSLIVLFSFTGAIISSLILYQATEKSFFAKAKVTNLIEKIQSETGYQKEKKYRYTGFVFIIFTFLILYYAYYPRLSFFSYAEKQGGKITKPVLKEETETLTISPIIKNFQADGRNLGMILTHVRNDKKEGITGSFVPFKLYIRLLDKDKKLISQSSFNAYEIIDSRFHPFGFPIQIDSEGKKYFIEYQLSEMSPSQDLNLITGEADFYSVYFEDKKNIFQRPILLLHFLINKFSLPLSNSMFWFTFFHVMPLPFLLFLYQGKHHRS